MDFINSLYARTVAENERNLCFWGEYLKSLQSLNFSLFSENLTVPVLVPVGSRIFFRGELKHTNEITVAIGADYFAKCSVKQAEILRQHRIKDAEAKVDMYLKEKEYLHNQIAFCKQNIYDTAGQEIVEVYSEEEERTWRQKHKENLKKYKLQNKDKEVVANTATDDELWNRLEELELQEELECELDNMNDTSSHKAAIDVKEENNKNIKKTEDLIQSSNDKILYDQKPASISKFDLLQQVIEKQNELGQELEQIKNKEKKRSKTEQDLISKLDEMEQLDELEDEMYRLDDIIHSEDVVYIEEFEEKPSIQKTKRRVMFADEDDSETIEITFKHSEIPPSSEPYNPEKGIQKPNDIYVAFENNFNEERTSILKKKKGEYVNDIREDTPIEENSCIANESVNTDKTIIIKDIIERGLDRNANMVGYSDARPTSLFKKKRLQNKS